MLVPVCATPMATLISNADEIGISVFAKTVSAAIAELPTLKSRNTNTTFPNWYAMFVVPAEPAADAPVNVTLCVVVVRRLVKLLFNELR